jgi:23S rRNA (guanosine2251-2'-O)-methyltransferase
VIVYGRNPVREALRGPRAVSRIWATKNALREPWLAGSRPQVASAEEIEARCGSAEHQGVCADVGPFSYAAEDRLFALGQGSLEQTQGERALRAQRLIVALDEVQDPQNLGAICRTAECAGAAAVVIPERRAATVTPAVCKASAGAVEHIPVCRVRNLADFLERAKRSGMWCYAADAAGEVAYDAVDYSGGVVLVLGSEGRGVRPRVAAVCDARVAIPLRGRTESLSVGAAAAVLLYAAAANRPA